MKPWICPKCGRVWSGMVTQCVPCNNKISRPRPSGETATE
jgi:hypothetical protein